MSRCISPWVVDSPHQQGSTRLTCVQHAGAQACSRGPQSRITGMTKSTCLQEMQSTCTWQRCYVNPRCVKSIRCMRTLLHREVNLPVKRQPIKGKTLCPRSKIAYHPNSHICHIWFKISCARSGKTQKNENWNHRKSQCHRNKLERKFACTHLPTAKWYCKFSYHSEPRRKRKLCSFPFPFPLPFPSTASPEENNASVVATDQWHSESRKKWKLKTQIPMSQ